MIMNDCDRLVIDSDRDRTMIVRNWSNFLIQIIKHNYLSYLIFKSELHINIYLFTKNVLRKKKLKVGETKLAKFVFHFVFLFNLCDKTQFSKKFFIQKN